MFMFSTNIQLPTKHKISFIKNQNVHIITTPSGINIISQQDTGNPGIILSEHITVEPKINYVFTVDIISKKTTDSGRIILWIGTSDNQLLSQKILDNGINYHTFTSNQQCNVKISIFFANPTNGINFILKNISLKQECIISTIQQPPSPKSKVKIDYYVSDADIQNIMNHLKGGPTVPPSPPPLNC